MINGTAMRTTSKGIFHDDFTLEREHHEDGENAISVIGLIMG
jgi:hypothetical protein